MPLQSSMPYLIVANSSVAVSITFDFSAGLWGGPISPAHCLIDQVSLVSSLPPASLQMCSCRYLRTLSSWKSLCLPWLNIFSSSLSFLLCALVIFLHSCLRTSCPGVYGGRPEEGVRSLGNGIIHGSEPLCGTGNRIWVFWRAFRAF